MTDPSQRQSNIAAFFRSTWNKVLGMLAMITLLLGVATEGAVLYGQSQEAAIKTEIAANAPQLKAAEAAKVTAEAKAAAALAVNAEIRQRAEKKFAVQTARVQEAIARYAERQKRGEADKLQAEANAAEEVAKNAEVKLRAEARLADLQAQKEKADAALQQWMTNCTAARGDRGRDLVACSSMLSSVFRGLGD